MTVMMIGAPTNSPAAYCQPRKMKASAATSIARLVLANMKASADVSAAPLVHRLRVADSAANEHDDDANPRTALRASCRGEPLPRCSAAARRDTKTWMAAETA